MTLEIVVFDGLRSFAFAEDAITMGNFKTYYCEKKIFKMSDRLSSVSLVSGNSGISGRKIKDLIDEYIEKTDVEDMVTIKEIMDSFNEFVSKTAEKVEISDYVNETFSVFKKKISSYINPYPQKSQFSDYLKYKSSVGSIGFLDDNVLLNQLISNCANLLSATYNDIEYEDLKFYLRMCYYDFLVENSINMVFVGYDECWENPTYFNYSILCNCEDQLMIVNHYSVCNCDSRMYSLWLKIVIYD